MNLASNRAGALACCVALAALGCGSSIDGAGGAGVDGSGTNGQTTTGTSSSSRATTATDASSSSGLDAASSTVGSGGATVGAGGGGASSAGGGGAGGAGGSNTGGGGASVSSAASVASSSGTGGACTVVCASPSACCDAACVAIYDDPMNCGGCGKVCPATAPVCSNGSCVLPACTSPVLCGLAATCCGTECCTGNRICCDVPGPGPTTGPKCVEPEKGTCPAGCPLCD